MGRQAVVSEQQTAVGAIVGGRNIGANVRRRMGRVVHVFRVVIQRHRQRHVVQRLAKQRCRVAQGSRFAVTCFEMGGCYHKTIMSRFILLAQLQTHPIGWIWQCG